MVLRDLYKKHIDRFIEGVIKADDDSNILQEVEEYIITDELNDKLETFFDVYTSSAAYRASNTGVWISGFFGSGKSHLLKILSYVLENRNIDGRSIGEIFLHKISRDSFELSGHVKKALTIPARTVLFNIDQKSDITSKSQPDAVLSVFIKVFNELQGYYPKYGYIAAFERDLDKQGLYADFKNAYKEIASSPWQQGREVVFFEIDNFSQALARVKGISKEDAARVIEQYEKQYSVSIEEFARHVKEYIDKQDKDFRLVFCVDEMGQYISENTKLMLNLQTIAESLATICKGQAWLLVTSQEDLENIIGDMNKRQANDFSRIQARFKTRLNLTSANVDEVIHKRLLEKNEKGVTTLTPLYEKEQNNFKTLYRFSDDSRQYVNFKDCGHFLFTYPFVPYQFDLFQSAIRGLSRHSAFQGRHQSVGERSMLGVFQVVARRLGDAQPGVSVSFDMLFDGIRATLRSEIQNAIIQAEKNLSEALDIRLLKALFLVKYVDEFVANVENLTSLMVDSFAADRLSLAQDIQTSLNRLQQQTYIQHTVGAYEFLTNEEKDIENEIKEQEVDAWEINETLAKFIFDDVIRDSNIRFEENKQDYPFSKKMDEATKGREYELGIHVFTPRY